MIGDNLDVVQRPQLYVDVDLKRFTGDCKHSSPTEMWCESPWIPIDTLNLNDDQDHRELNFGFLMDSVNSVMDLSDGDHNPFPQFRIYHTPIYDKLIDHVKYYQDGHLTSNGTNLDKGSQALELVVMIGHNQCNVTSLTANQLICYWTPGSVTRLNYEVKVFVGSGFESMLCRFQYNHHDNEYDIVDNMREKILLLVKTGLNTVVSFGGYK